MYWMECFFVCVVDGVIVEVFRGFDPGLGFDV